MAAPALVPRITAAGLPHRTEAVLARERAQFAATVAGVLDLGKAEPAMSPEVSADDVAGGLGSDRVGVRIAAAWLSGRVAQPEGDEPVAEVVRRLPAFVDTFDPADIGPQGPAYVEGLMSMVLAGQRSGAEPKLIDVVEHDDWVNSHRFLAAYYLAQMGDPRGWPVMTADLADDEPHTRLMAVRHLLAFRPHEGADAAGRLRAALRDPDPYVAVEVPALLLEAGVDDVEGDLEEATKDPFPPEVRDAAAHALAHLRGT